MARIRKSEIKVRKQIKSIENRLYYLQKKGRITKAEASSLRVSTKGISKLSASQLRSKSNQLSKVNIGKSIQESRKGKVERAKQILNTKINSLMSRSRLSTNQRAKLRAFDKQLSYYTEVEQGQEINIEDLVGAEGIIYGFEEIEGEQNKSNLLDSISKIFSYTNNAQLMERGYNAVDKLRNMSPSDFIDMYYNEKSIADLWYKYHQFMDKLGDVEATSKDYDEALLSLTETATSMVGLLEQIIEERNL